MASLWREHEAIKNHLTSVAIIAGGIWTYLLFVSLHQVKRADAELAALRQDPVANIDISAVDAQLPDQRSAGMIVTVSIVNSGRLEAVLNFSNSPPLSVVRLHTDSQGALFAEAPMAFQILAIMDGKSIRPLPKATLLPGEKTKYHFLIPALRPGMYLIQFSAPVQTKESTGWHWVARRFHVFSGPSTERHARQVPRSRCS